MSDADLAKLSEAAEGAAWWAAMNRWCVSVTGSMVGLRGRRGLDTVQAEGMLGYEYRHERAPAVDENRGSSSSLMPRNTVISGGL